MNSHESLGKILIVDSDENICDLLSVNLKEVGFAVSIVPNTRDIVDDTLTDIRLILVDAMDQDFNGISFTHMVKNSAFFSHVPVILMTSAEGEDFIVRAFDAGVDDFVSKPFSLRELVARVRAVLRRHPLAAVPVAQKNNNDLSFGDIVMDMESRHVSDHNGIVPLSRTEFAILALLLKNRNNYFSRSEIKDHVWKGENISNDRIVDTNISRLRKKLGVSGEHIINRYGMGYALVDQIPE